MMKHLVRILGFVACAGLGAAPVPAVHAPVPACPRLKLFMFRDAPLEYVMNLIGDTWGKHIVVYQTARDIRVRTFYKDIDCAAALKAVCRANALWYTEDPDGKTVFVQRREEYTQNSLFNETKSVKVLTIAYPRAEDLADTLQEIFRDMVVYTRPDKDNGNDYDDIELALDRMDQLSERSTVLEGDASTSSSSSSSRSNSSSSQRRQTRQGISEGIDNVTDYYRDVNRLNKAQVDQVTSSPGGAPKSTLPGVVFLSVVKRSNSLVLRSSDVETLKQVETVIRELDVPKPQVLLEMRVLALDVTDEKDRQFDFIVKNDSHAYRTGMAGFAGNLMERYNEDNVMGALGVEGASVANGNSVFQVIGKNYEVRLKLLNEKNKVRSLATPNLLVADFEASRIFVGDEASILTDVTSTQSTTTGDNPVVTTTENPVTERRDVGTTLVVTPKVHKDGTVTLRVMQESAELGQARKINYGTQGKSLETTDVNKQTITSTIVAKNGETIALGGLVQTKDIDDEQKIPVLGDIPYLGWFFRRMQKSKSYEELMVLIRPTVILTPHATHPASEELLKATLTDAASVQEALDKTRAERIRKSNANLTRDLEAEAKVEQERKDNKSWFDWKWFGDGK